MKTKARQLQRTLDRKEIDIFPSHGKLWHKQRIEAGADKVLAMNASDEKSSAMDKHLVKDVGICR